MGVTAATAWAWALAVLFAFVTNKLWVFRSRTRGLAALGHELAAFVAARLFSGLLDVAMMWLFAEKLGWPDMWVKSATTCSSRRSITFSASCGSSASGRDGKPMLILC